jgi:hypothetical protein
MEVSVSDIQDWKDWTDRGMKEPRPSLWCETVIMHLGLQPIPDEWYAELSLADFLDAQKQANKWTGSYVEAIQIFRQTLNRKIRKVNGPSMRGLRWQILERDSHTCQSCGRKAPNAPLEIDHIIPVNSGGATVKENLRTLCQDCNQGKRGQKDVQN